MISRRDFLARGTTLLLLVPLTARCSSSTPSYGGGPSPAGSTSPNGCSGVSSTSSVAESHTHTLCVANADLTSPPAAGMTLTTSTTSEHAHTVSLTAAELRAIAAGQTVTVATSSVVDPLDGVMHTHTFAIMPLVAVDAGAPNDAAAAGDTAPANPPATPTPTSPYGRY